MIAFDLFAVVGSFVPAVFTLDGESREKSRSSLVKVTKKNLLSLTALAAEEKIPGTWGESAHHWGGLSVGGKRGEVGEPITLPEAPPHSQGECLCIVPLKREVCTVADEDYAGVAVLQLQN
jgi:hypothetical protein